MRGGLFSSVFSGGHLPLQSGLSVSVGCLLTQEQEAASCSSALSFSNRAFLSWEEHQQMFLRNFPKQGFNTVFDVQNSALAL